MSRLQPVIGESASSLWLFGVEYTKRLLYSTTQPVGIFVQGNQLVINPVSPVTSLNHPSIKNQLLRFTKSTAQAYMVPRIASLAQTMKTEYGRISFKQQRSRWGSCSSLGNLNFNWRLVHFPTPIIDYVIIHELAHRTHLNHSSAFWQLVGRFDPEYSKHRGWLKRRQLVVE